MRIKSKFYRRIARRKITILAWVAGFAVVSILILTAVRAATFTASSEAESGQIGGSAALTNDTGASGGKAVAFGAIDNDMTPTNLRGYTGGNSIALRWRAPSITYGTVKYHVYRDNVRIATVDAATATPWKYEQPGTSYVDKNVTAGAAYTYKVVAESGNKTSGFTSDLRLTHPTVTSAVPTVTVQRNGLSGLDTYAANATETLKVWYPKAVDMIVGGAYNTPTNITVNVVSSSSVECATYRYAGWVTGGSVFNVCYNYVQSEPNDMSLVVHEVTHIIQNLVGGSHMTIEGTASWVSDRSTGYIQPKPTWPAIYDNGYGIGSYFFSWLATTYNQPNIVRDINIAVHNQTATDYAVIKQKTGKSIGSLFSEAAGYYTTSPGHLVNVAGPCLDVTNGSITDGTILSVRACKSQTEWTDIYQQTIYASKTATANAGGILYLSSADKCLRTQNNSTAYAAYVVIGACDSSAIATWVPTGGALKNAASGYCLQPEAGSVADGTRLLVGSCDDLSSVLTRRWTVPAQ